MSSLSSLISGGGGALPQIALTQSQTWVPPQDGNVCIHVIGGGGGGFGGSDSSPYGGGAGGYCKQTSLAVTTAGSFTIVVGAAGTFGSNNQNGGAGGNSTVAGTGLSSTLTANGGAGGTGSAGGAGGTASNATVNFTGGAGGEAGGGAVGVYGTGNSADQFGGGLTDSLGDQAMSGYGYIYGGLNGARWYNQTSSNGLPSMYNQNAKGWLSGGAKYDTNGGSAFALVGIAIIGGGGGPAYTPTAAGWAKAGSGGAGIVLIQYLPS